MIEQLNQKMINAVKHLDKEFSTIRTSRANPSMLDNIFEPCFLPLYGLVIIKIFFIYIKEEFFLVLKQDYLYWFLIQF